MIYGPLVSTRISKSNNLDTIHLMTLKHNSNISNKFGVII